MSVFDKYKYKKQYNALLLALYLFYLCTMTIKMVYSAQMLEIIEAYKTTRANVALGLTIYYFVYAAAQILLAIFISKINMKKYLIVTIFFSCICFGMIGWTDQLWQLWLLMGLNGIFQSASWGGVTYTLSKHYPNDTLSHCQKILATGQVLGTAFSYGFSAFFVEFFSWEYTFVFMAVLYLLSLLYFVYRENKLERALKKGDEVEAVIPFDEKKEYVVPEQKHFNVILFFFFICVLSFVTNLVYYGTGNWIPNLLYEVHKFPSSLSIFVTLITPLICFPASIIMYSYYDKTNKIIRGVIFIGLITLSLFVVMIFGYAWNLVFAILMSAILRFLVSCFISGAGSYTLMKFKNHINAGTSTLIINALASIGAGVAPFVTGLVMDNHGWQAYYIFLAVMTAAAILIAFIGSIVIKKRKRISSYV